MFTGLIEEVGTVASVRSDGGGQKLRIRAALSGKLASGQSIAVSGVCQTVVENDEHTFTVLAVEETLRKTTFGSLRDGMPVNLERAMLPASRLDGHIVQGHIDTTGEITGVEEEGAGRLFRVQFDPQYAHHIVPVGSIALDGISLTVAHIRASHLTVAIIPHTYMHTNVATWQRGTQINMEFDLIGKYVARYLDCHPLR